MVWGIAGGVVLAFIVGCSPANPAVDGPSPDEEEALVPTDECPWLPVGSVDEAEAAVTDLAGCQGYDVEALSVECSQRHVWLLPPRFPDGLAGAWVVGEDSVECAYSGPVEGGASFSAGEDRLDPSGISRLTDFAPTADGCLDELAELHGSGASSVEQLSDAWSALYECDGSAVPQIECWGPTFGSEPAFACRLLDEAMGLQMLVNVAARR